MKKHYFQIIFAILFLSFTSPNVYIEDEANQTSKSFYHQSLFTLKEQLRSQRTTASLDLMMSPVTIGGVDLGNLTDYLFVFTDGRDRANLQGATKGFIGDIAIDGLQADEVTSGSVAYAGTIYTNDNTLDAWQDLVDQNAAPDVNPSQAFSSTGNISLINDLENDLNNAFSQINALSVTSGYANVNASSLDGLNTQDGVADIIVINITSGFQVNDQITITGDAEDVFFFRWDEDANFSDGYEGEVKFQSGGAFIPNGGLIPSNFIHVAGTISSSGGGGNPPIPFPQGPRDNDGTGNLIIDGDDFTGGGFFTGYWLTTGDPDNNFENSDLSNGIFVGGWYTSATRFTLTSGTSSVHVTPNDASLGVCMMISSLSNSPTTCNSNDGSIQLNIVGGTSPYTYNWTNGIDSGTGNGIAINNLATGTYSITINDNAGCTDTIYTSVDALSNCSNPQSCLGAAANYGILVLENGDLTINSATNISGDVGYSANVTSIDNKKAGNDGPFDGTAFVHTNINSFAYDSGNFLPSGGVIQNNSTEDARLDQANIDAIAATNFYSNLSPDIILGNLQDNDNQTINRVGNLTVVEIASLDYKEDVLELVGQAGQNDAFVINILGDFDFSGSEIRLTNVSPEQVVFNFPNASNILLNKANNIFNGTILAPTAVIEYHNPAIFNGAIIGSNIDLHSDFNLHHYGLDISCTEIFPNSIGDLVWLDLNGNALFDPLEAGIESMPVMISNQNPMNINGTNYPIGTYVDTVFTDINGMFAFDSLPDGNWQMEVLHNPTFYFPTYDADGGLLNICDFVVTNGVVSSTDNNWCSSGDCALDLDFGLRFNGNLNLGGQVCIDHDNDGICSTGGETQLKEIEVNLYDSNGKYFGGVPTQYDGSYLFPFLLDSSYHVALNVTQQNLHTYHFTTEEEDTPASAIFQIGDFIFQDITLQQDVFGVDYGFALTPCSITALNDSLFLCPGIEIENTVSMNDTYLGVNTTHYTIVNPPSYGTVSIDSLGSFVYTPTQIVCGEESFTYQVCNQNNTCCDRAEVVLLFEDVTKPTLINVPADLTIYCDESLPSPPLVSAFDNCPRIGINITENNTQGEDGCSLYDYTLTRVWTATDYCGNFNSDEQVIDVVDVTAPDIYKIYTLPNGKKMVAGVMEGVGPNWKTINLPIDFATNPIVLAQVTTANETTPIAVQLRNISNSQFEMKITEEENNDQIHSRENISWVAIEPGVQTENYSFEADFVFSNDILQTHNLHQIYAAAPTFFAQSQTTNEKDVVTVSSTQITNSSYKLQLKEEQSADTETNHMNEKIGYLAIPQLGAIRDAKDRIFGESGSINITSNWQTINFTHDYINPVIIANTVSQNESDPFTIRVRNVTPSGCEIRMEEWENADGIHTSEMANYLVVEGSLPIDLPNFCENGTDSLELGIDIKAIDNCDASVVIQYSEIDVFFGAKKITQRAWTATDECGNQTAYTQEVICEGVSLQVKSLLQGAMLNNNGDGLMRDDLRQKGLIPHQEPYYKMSGFTHINGNPYEQIDTNLLSITGKNAVVDWVFVELRAAQKIDSVVATYSGLIQRDGNIITPKGDTLLHFYNTPIGEYYVSIRHRNHIGLTNLTPTNFNQNLIPQIDYTNQFTPVNGQNPTTPVEDKKAMWSGDLNSDGKIIYQGPQNDVFEMFLQVLLDDQNTSYLTNFINQGYTNNDFNLDGVVIYQGPNNDRANLLFNTILKHPKNPQRLANFIIQVKLD